LRYIKRCKVRVRIKKDKLCRRESRGDDDEDEKRKKRKDENRGGKGI
jgi:hypothetical protein